jgi:hypothetical protein
VFTGRYGLGLILQVKKDKTQIPLAHFDRCVTLLFFAHTDRRQVTQRHFPSRVSTPNSTILIPPAKIACSSFRCILQNIANYTDQKTSASNLCGHRLHVKKAQRPTVIANIVMKTVH